MLLTPRMENAIAVTLGIHAKQKRKGDKITPYAVHPILVGMLLAKYTDDEDIIIAGLLHDALEDTKYREKQIRDNFGERVLSIVEEVTEKDPKAPWEKRKMDYLMSIPKKSTEACLVVCADKIHNLNSLAFLYKSIGESLWRRFNAPKEKKIWYYENIYKELKKKFRHGLIRELHHALKEFKEVGAKDEKPKDKKHAKRFIGPFDLVKWNHFSTTGKEEVYLVETYTDMQEAMLVANQLTRKAREEATAELPERANLTAEELWSMSYSYGVYDSTGQIAYWPDWLNV